MSVLRKCNKCGFEAKTEQDLKLFKTHSRYDPYLSSYPYGKDPICLKCYRAYDNKAQREKRAQNPELFRQRVNEHFRKYPEKQKAVAWANTHLETGTYCILCGISDVPLEKHHPDYKRPDFVVTLCRSCHHKLHVKVRVSTQSKEPLCNHCNHHPDIEGSFLCTYWNRHVAEGQKRKNYCKGFSTVAKLQDNSVYFCIKIKRILTQEELARLNCLHSQKRHWGTFTHKLGPCPNVSKVNAIPIQITE